MAEPDSNSAGRGESETRLCAAPTGGNRHRRFPHHRGKGFSLFCRNENFRYILVFGCCFRIARIIFNTEVVTHFDISRRN